MMTASRPPDSDSDSDSDSDRDSDSGGGEWNPPPWVVAAPVPDPVLDSELDSGADSVSVVEDVLVVSEKEKKKYRKVPLTFVDENTGAISHISKKEATFLRHYPELGRTGAEKYAKLGSGQTSPLLKMPAVQQYLRKVLWSAGVTDEKIATRIAEGLDATTAKQFMTREGAVVEGPGQVDYDQRGKYIDRALAMQGLAKVPHNGDGEGGNGGAQINLNMAVLSIEDLKTLAKALSSPSSPSAEPGGGPILEVSADESSPEPDPEFAPDTPVSSEIADPSDSGAEAVE